MTSGHLLDGGALNRVVLYVSALMEVKSALGAIVAAPTAGACAATRPRTRPANQPKAFSSWPKQQPQAAGRVTREFDRRWRDRQPQFAGGAD